MATGPRPLLSFFRGPFFRNPVPPRVRPEALAATYVVRRPAGGGAVVLWREADGSEHELAAARGRFGWPRLARALLEDALEAPPSRRLVKDYSRFVVPRRGAERTTTGAELQAWLETWRPSVIAVLGSGR